MATLRMTGFRVDTRSITISFSEKVDHTAPLGPGSTNATEPSNYSIFAPNAGLIDALPPGWTPGLRPDGRTVVMDGPSPVFSPGDWVSLTVTNVGPDPASGGTAITSEKVTGRVPSEAARMTRDVEDAISYPVLTEEVAYRPSPVGISTSGAGGIGGPGASNLGQVALQAVTDVLGWKANATDPKGFIGALTQAFTLTDVEGHVESKWVPRSYAVQTDLGGGITGAQASLYMRAKDALDQSLSLLDGLYPLDPEADPEYVKALREMARSQMNEIVKEFGVVGLPSILRIDTYFKILLGQDISSHQPPPIEFDPDKIKGTLGDLRDEYAIYFRGNPFNNSIEDEQDITNFRVISDYMTSLLQSWIANRDFFRVIPKDQAFFGTQLVLISRQFNVIAETVNEVRFALDSVFIGPNERQALLLKFKDHSLPPMFLEDVLEEVEGFASDEGPRLLRDGGKISVKNNILPVVRSLERLIKGAHDPQDPKSLPDGFRTARVRHALDDLLAQLGDLAKLTEQVEQSLPLSEDKLAISGVVGPYQINGTNTFKLSVFGRAFDRKIKVLAHSPAPTAAIGVDFVSPERIDVTFPFNLGGGIHEITLTNPNGESATRPNAFQWDPLNAPVTILTTTLDDAIVNSIYNKAGQKLQAKGGVPPYVWKITNGSLPSDLTLDSGGLISGTLNPGAVGVNSFEVTATDQNGSTATQSLTIEVYAMLSITTNSLLGATLGSLYSQAVGATGGPGSYTWKVSNGSLPPGLSLDSAKGEISGTPTTDPNVPQYPEAYSFEMTVTSGTQTASQQLSIEVSESACGSPPITFRATVGSFFSQKLQANGGTSPLTWSAPGNDLPSGLTLSTDGVLSGTPTEDGAYHFSVEVTDSNGSAATQKLIVAAHDEVRDRIKHLDEMVDTLSRTVEDLQDQLDQLLDQTAKRNRRKDRGRRDKAA